MKKDDTSVHDIVAVLAGLKSENDVRIFWEALLTPPERARIALRWRLVCLLTAGVTHRKIVKKLGVSLCKITRGSRELKFKPAFRQMVNDHRKIKKDKLL